ncbi:MULTISPECIES: flagellar motor switch protein FliG [Oceanibaculum]|jgi:flagellar motor switch protein FliG|uniref:Flagellar motor switch protein FliG n=2 Tax=Oceanibaculum indicum TaxID=526216 RepID=K2J6H7_9PROT|nr:MULTISPECIES: flagellar motor switch protein FliG [Oceanibaculum]EKE70537.1 flagellar motor switch protein G [Oceanibaculum indicum P24]MCH2394715.1 flagellar motor switch protein FliG [Oceanibaculum sp.]RKQ73823.1 flagellar motor switch protein FliG [Oceanibaculum indicum]
MRVREDYRSLGGPEKAAILLMSLGEEHAAKIFALMEDEEIKEVSQVMANLGTVSSNIVERLFVEFAEQISSTGSLVGSFDSTERLLSKVLDPDRVGDIMEEIRGPAGRTMWDKLGNVNELVLANYLKNEYPQTVAVVMSKINPAHAAKVLALLPENFAMEVVMRMLRMESVQKDILNDVERVLRTEFMSNLARSNRRDPHEMMAEIFNSLDRATETRFVTALEERNRDAAEKIKSLMFTFEDLARLDPGGVQTLLRTAEKDKLGLALKGSTEDLRDLFFSNMSERAAKLMREDMAGMGPVRLKEVEEAQTYMVQLAKDLANRGEIVIAESGGDDQLIY